MKKYLKITLLVIIAIILVGTFVFLYPAESKPKVIVYETLAAEVTDLEKTTVEATGKVEPRDEILIKPQISGNRRRGIQRSGTERKKRGSDRESQSNSRTRTTELLAESRVRLGEINAKQVETRLYPCIQEVI